jgi:hypothetical protein
VQVALDRMRVCSKRTTSVIFEIDVAVDEIVVEHAAGFEVVAVRR